MKKHTTYLTTVLLLFLSGCGYHLVGQGDAVGVIPNDATQLLLIEVAAKNNEHHALFRAFQQRLAEMTEAKLVRRDEAQLDAVEVRLEGVTEQFSATAFDASGIANQYRLRLSASVRVLKNGEELWGSGVIAASGDVFAIGSSVAIEAQKERVLQSLRDEWVQKAVSRMRSGF